MLTYRNLWTESSAINSAPAPAGKGEPGRGERTPFELTVNAETFPEPELAIKAKLVVDPGEMVGFMPPLHPFMSRRENTSANVGSKIQVCQ